MFRMDVTGNGLLDLLEIDSQNNEIIWYPWLGKEGFRPVRRVKRSPSGPFPPSTSSLYDIVPADMSGDGLTDLVYLSNRKISYWPNLGYGHFGEDVIMQNTPALDRDDQFSVERIRLADVDGSGSYDILYLPGEGGADLYINLSGTGWSRVQKIAGFPWLNSLESVSVIDLLGNGTVCLCWSGYDRIAGKPAFRYMDLMGSQKPHLLSGYWSGPQDARRIFALNLVLPP